MEANLPGFLRIPGSPNPRTAHAATAVPAAAAQRRPHPALHAVGEERPGGSYARVRYIRLRRPRGTATHRLARCRSVRRRPRGLGETARQLVLARPGGSVG